METDHTSVHKATYNFLVVLAESHIVWTVLDSIPLTDLPFEGICRRKATQMNDSDHLKMTKEAKDFSNVLCCLNS